MRRHQIQLGHGAPRQFAQLIQRLAQSIDHAAQQLVAHGYAQGMAGGNHLTARTNAVHFAQRHEQ